MTNTTVTAAALAVALVTGAANADDRFAFATLDNGVSIGFALARTGDDPGHGGPAGEVVLPRSNGVSRVLWDRASGAYFGYRVEITRQGAPRPFRVAVKALDGGAVERELRRRHDCASCPAPAPLGAALPRFPPPQSLAEGEALTLDLLTNPTTGVRIFDVLVVSARPASAEGVKDAVSRAVDGRNAVEKAAALVARGQYPAAAEQYRLALERQPNDATVHNKLGICYQHLQEHALAQRAYERALELNPGYAEVWNNLGALEHSRARYKQAVRAYRKAIDLKPALATPWKNLGSAYLAMERIADAFEAYQEAFRLDPTVLENDAAGIHTSGLDAATQAYYIAKVLAQKGQKDAALNFLKRAKDAGFRDVARIRSDADFRAVVDDPRFKEIFPE